MATEKKTQYDRFSISLPMDLSQEFDHLRETLKISRSDAIRKAMQSFIIQETQKQAENSGKIIFGTITYMEKSHIHAHPPTESHEHINPKKESQKHQKKNHSHIHLHDHSQYYTSMEQLEFIKANELQHDFMDIILSQMHIHAGSEKCMIVIAIRGRYERVLELFNSLHALKTIQNIKLEIVDVE